jgi:hypothetical protein
MIQHKRQHDKYIFIKFSRLLLTHPRQSKKKIRGKRRKTREYLLSTTHEISVRELELDEIFPHSKKYF